MQSYPLEFGYLKSERKKFVYLHSDVQSSGDDFENPHENG